MAKQFTILMKDNIDNKNVDQLNFKEEKIVLLLLKD